MHFKQAPMTDATGAVVFRYAPYGCIGAIALVPGIGVRFRKNRVHHNMPTPMVDGVVLAIDKDSECPYVIEYLRPGVGKIIERLGAADFAELCTLANNGESDVFESLLH